MVDLVWGRRGAQVAAARGDVLIVVDVLSFCSAVAVAVARGAEIHPCRETDDAAMLAAALGAELAVHRRDVPALGRCSLSPVSFLDAPSGARFVLPSPNGAACAHCGSAAPALFAGALVNAAATAQAALGAARSAGAGITVVACGERWVEPAEEGRLRFALEDYLGAGAIIAAITDVLPDAGPSDAERSVGARSAPSSARAAASSAEARVCAAAFTAARSDLAGLIWECESGVELRVRSYGADVELAARLDLYTAAAVLTEGIFVASAE